MSDTDHFAASPFTVAQVDLAARNYANQERLLADLRGAAEMAGIGAEALAKELEIPEADAADWLDGEADLSLSDIRHMANALDACVVYSVRPLNTSFREMWRSIEPRLTYVNKTWASAPDWLNVPGITSGAKP